MTRRWSPLIALLVLCAASQAHAWDAFFRVSSETTVRVTSETTSEASSDASSASTRSGNRARRERQQRRDGVAGMACSSDDDCAGWCREGQCADSVPAQAPTAPPAAYYCVDDTSCAPGFTCFNRQCLPSAPQPGPACSTDAQCYQGQSCVNGQCVPLAPQPAPTCSTDAHCYQGQSCVSGQCVPLAQPGPGCSTDAQCYQGQRCVNGQCVLAPQPPPACSTDAQCYQGQSCISGQCISPPPPPPPGASLRRRGSELFLRDRTVQLRQDLALGEGPVIATLAEMNGVSARLLGRAMRARRAELVTLMGDGRDVTWTRRFLVEVEALCEQQASVSVR